jgi:hypothetical protein
MHKLLASASAAAVALGLGGCHPFSSSAPVATVPVTVNPNAGIPQAGPLNIPAIVDRIAQGSVKACHVLPTVQPLLVIVARLIASMIGPAGVAGEELGEPLVERGIALICASIEPDVKAALARRGAIDPNALINLGTVALPDGTLVPLQGYAR